MTHIIKNDVSITGSITGGGNLSCDTIDSGTWTITMGDVTNAFTLSSEAGEYHRIGKMIFASGRVNWSGKGSATGNISVSLPFTPVGDRTIGTSGFASNITFNSQLVYVVGDRGLRFWQLNSGSVSTTLAASAFGPSGEIQFSCNFFVA